MDQARDGNSNMKDALLGQDQWSVYFYFSDRGNGRGCQRRVWDADPFQQPIPVYTVLAAPSHAPNPRCRQTQGHCHLRGEPRLTAKHHGTALGTAAW